MAYSTFGASESHRPSYMQPAALGGSTFTVAGIAGQSSSPLSSSTWGSSAPGPGFGASMSDTLSQSRPHYTQGYLMSMSQSSSPQQSYQRHDEPPLVPTRAKIHNPLSRSSALDFGKESMFQSSRQRPTLADEDAPPTTSVNDIVDDFRAASHTLSGLSQSVLRESTMRQPLRAALPSASQPASQLVYVVVFGYPPDKYTLTAEYFRSLGESIETDPNADVTNCFRIGYRDPAAAMRAVRKNGEVLGGSWMIGAKWADPVEAEMIFGTALGKPTSFSLASSSAPLSPGAHRTAPNYDMDEDDQLPSSPEAGALVPATVTVGVPLKLAPSTAAFRQSGVPKSAEPVPQSNGNSHGTVNTVTTQNAGKGMFGQVSDLIFGW